jgi:hypothetical protein
MIFSGVVTSAVTPPTGTVVLYDNAGGTQRVLGRVLVGLRGKWTLIVGGFAGNIHSVGDNPHTAVYQGNATYQRSTSATLIERITLHS